MAQRVGRGIALLFHDRGTRRGLMVSSTPRPQLTPGKDPVPILQEAEWARGRSGQAENLVLTGIRSRTVQPVVSIIHFNMFAVCTINYLKMIYDSRNMSLNVLCESTAYYRQKELCLKYFTRLFPSSQLRNIALRTAMMDIPLRIT